jgi:hypothetical protein
MIHHHKEKEWLVRTRDGHTITVEASTFYFAREAACSALQCEREDLLDIKEMAKVIQK